MERPEPGFLRRPTPADAGRAYRFLMKLAKEGDRNRMAWDVAVGECQLERGEASFTALESLARLALRNDEARARLIALAREGNWHAVHVLGWYGDMRHTDYLPVLIDLVQSGNVDALWMLGEWVDGQPTAGRIFVEQIIRNIDRGQVTLAPLVGDHTALFSSEQLLTVAAQVFPNIAEAFGPEHDAFTAFTWALATVLDAE